MLELVEYNGASCLTAFFTLSRALSWLPIVSGGRASLGSGSIRSREEFIFNFVLLEINVCPTYMDIEINHFQLIIS